VSLEQVHPFTNSPSSNRPLWLRNTPKACDSYENTGELAPKNYVSFKSLPEYILKPFQNMKFTFISGITLSVVVRLGVPLGTSEAPDQDADSPFGCMKRENEKHITIYGKEMTTFHSHILDSNIELDLSYVKLPGSFSQHMFVSYPTSYVMAMYAWCEKCYIFKL
jgi:hypothetical protein